MTEPRAVPDPGWARARNVLCVRLDSLGDVLMTTPAVRAVRESIPGSCITLLTSTEAAPIGRLIPEIDRVIAYDAPWLKTPVIEAGSLGLLAMAQRLKDEAFDAAVIFTVYSQSALPAAVLCYLAEIPLRLAHSHENPYQLLTSWVPDPEPAECVRHEARRQLDLVAAVGCSTGDERLSLHIDPETVARVRRRLEGLGLVGDTRWVVVHPGASAPSRRYPARHFAAVVQAFVAELGWQVVLSGGANEVALVEEVRAAAGVSAISMAGQLDLQELSALLTLAPLLVSNNTGPVHVAAAVGTPVVDLYALTNPQHTPWLVPSRVLFHDVPCRDCYKSICPAGHHACLDLVPPSAVVQAASELMRQARLPRSCASERALVGHE